MLFGSSCVTFHLKYAYYLQLLARLGAKPSLAQLEPALFGPEGPVPKQVYELYGEEATGKSQALLHLCVTCLLPPIWRGVDLGGYNVGAIYIDNDYHFNMLRLTAVMEQRIVITFQDQQKESVQSLPSDEDVETFIKQCLTKLYLVRCNNSSQLVITLHALESLLGSKPNICLLIIDSIGAFYWIDRSNGGDSFQAQEANLNKVSEIVEQLKNAHNLVVFATKPAIFQKRQKGGDDTGQFESPHTNLGKKHEHKNIGHCEYLCRSWQKLVAHRWIFTRNVVSVLEGGASGEKTKYTTHFHVRSDLVPVGCLKVNKQFIIGNMGLQFQS